MSHFRAAAVSTLKSLTKRLKAAPAQGPRCAEAFSETLDEIATKTMSLGMPRLIEESRNRESRVAKEVMDRIEERERRKKMEYVKK